MRAIHAVESYFEFTKAQDSIGYMEAVHYRKVTQGSKVACRYFSLFSPQKKFFFKINMSPSDAAVPSERESNQQSRTRKSASISAINTVPYELFTLLPLTPCETCTFTITRQYAKKQTPTPNDTTCERQACARCCIARAHELNNRHFREDLMRTGRCTLCILTVRWYSIIATGYAFCRIRRIRP